MKISRRGTSANHGESSIELGDPMFAWSSSDSCLDILQAGIRDFSTRSRHSYTISLTVTEINAILKTLSDAAVKDPDKFEKNLGISLKAILRIQAVLSGVKI